MIARLAPRYAMVAALAFAVIGVATPAAAQAQGPQPSPAALLLARQLIEVKGVKATFNPIVRGVVEKVKDALMQTNFMWSKDLNEVAGIVYKEYDPRVSELLDSTAHIYATHFTEPELKDMLAFYKSPLGKKMLEEEPKAVDESMSNAADWADNLASDVMNKMRAEMKKRGHDL